MPSRIFCIRSAVLAGKMNYMINRDFLLKCILTFLVCFYVIFIYRKWKFFKFSWNNNLFFVPFLPCIGTMYVALLSGARDAISAVIFIDQHIGFPFNLWHGHDYYYFTKDAAEAKILLYNLSAQNKSTVYRDVAYVFQNSLLTIHYNKWRVRRREYLKCFKPSTLKIFSLDYYNNSCGFIDNIKKQNGGQKISYDLFTKYAFKNFFATSVGLDKEPKNMHRFGECLMQFQEDVARKLLDPLTHPAIWLRLHPGGRNTAKNMKEIKSIAEEIINEKRAQRTDFKSFVDSEDTPPLLDLMMSLKGNLMNDLDIFDDLVFFSAAAADTSGHCLMITFTLIGMFQDVQEKIYQEVINLVGNKPICSDDLPLLIYTESVIHESLRLFPVIPILSRILEKDIDLGNKVIPKGSNIGISVYHLQRNEKYWNDPLKFDPTRFLPENATKIHPFSYLAFSAGPRDCLGKTQAIAMLKITVASVVRSFKITSKHKSIKEFKVMSSLSLKTRHALDCHFTPRFQF